MLDHKRRVEEVESLKWGGRDGTLGADLSAVWKVEGRKDLVVDAPHSLLVDHSPPGVGTVVVGDLPLSVGLFDVVNAEAPAANFRVEFS